MKRILTLLFLGFVFQQIQAQTLFFQDFESGDVAPMSAVDVDGLPIEPSIANVAGPTWKTIQYSATNKVALSTSWFSPAGVCDDWLISPPITVVDSNTFLNWEAWSYSANYRDGYQVRISTTDDQIASFSTLALNIGAELTAVTKRAVSLKNYVGQTIYFAFRNNSNDKWYLFLDNIKVEVLRNHNVVVKSVDFEKYNTLGTNVTVKTQIENKGAKNITSVKYDYEVNGTVYSDSVIGLNLAPYKITTLSHKVQFNETETGEYPVNISMTQPSGKTDEEPDDNAGFRNVYFLDKALPKKVVVEEATGTWCIWCPRGAVFMDLISQTYPDVAIPIAVHNFDPMTIEEYDTPFSQSVGGYPSGHVDRKARDIDPLDFESNLNNLRNRTVPVHVSTESEWDETSRTITMRGTGYLSIPTQANNLRFVGVITENDVHGTDAGYDQANIYADNANGPMGGFENLPNPVPAAQMTYHFVARALLGGFNGLENSIPDAVGANEEFQVEFSYQVPEEYNIQNMKSIIFVLDEETGEILNGDIVPSAGGVSVPVIPQGRFVAYPNPTTDVLNLEVDYQTEAQISMSIYDTYGKLIRSLGSLDLTAGKQVKEIQVAELPTGNYILELRNKNAVTALPFTKI